MTNNDVALYLNYDMLGSPNYIRGLEIKQNKTQTYTHTHTNKQTNKHNTYT